MNKIIIYHNTFIEKKNYRKSYYCYIATFLNAHSLIFYK